MPKIKTPEDILVLENIWPWNLALAIYKAKSNEAKADVLRSVAPRGLYAALETLSDREQTVLQMRYRDGMTLEEAGREQNVTRERIRQVEAKALRKLRHPARQSMIQWLTRDEYLELSRLGQAQIESCMEELRRLVGELKSMLLQEPAPATAPNESILSRPIDELNLSVRSYNCLNRAGVDTIGDVARMSRGQLMRVRNLGRKCMEEIIEKLKELGLEVPEDDE